MKKALIVGIDHYEHVGSLSGCVADAHSVKNILSRNADGTINFQAPRLMTSSSANDVINRGDLKAAIRELFEETSEIALLYFSGHGYLEDIGGYLCTGECRSGDDGLPLAEILAIAARSSTKNKVIILDSCHSGVAGGRADAPGTAEISEGMTILTASTANQVALTRPSGGIFTNLLVDALSGAAANLVGDVTPGSVYAHIDQSLGSWGQRPVFKTNVRSFVSLRKATPPLPFADLLALRDLFPTPDHVLKLDPSFEPERPGSDGAGAELPQPDLANVAIFERLQRCAKVNLVRPVDAPHMWHAAMQSKGCELTVLGQHYRNLVANDLI